MEEKKKENADLTATCLFSNGRKKKKENADVEEDEEEQEALYIILAKNHVSAYRYTGDYSNN